MKIFVNICLYQAFLLVKHLAHCEDTDDGDFQTWSNLAEPHLICKV